MCVHKAEEVGQWLSSTIVSKEQTTDEQPVNNHYVTLVINHRISSPDHPSLNQFLHSI